ncbi:MAG: exo-alpha-sialidase [bacterium]|nr:exo-alpha-sialidase [bacterium]
MTMGSNAAHEAALLRLLEALIDQDKARVIVPPNEAASGFWFGGGNVAADATGTLWLIGRYRNFGDSRTGLKAGDRGLELALFSSANGGESFDKVQSWSKDDLSYDGRQVLSIEGAALRLSPGGACEVFVSTEKDEAYPAELAAFQKPGTGVWSVDRMTGPTPDSVDAATLEPIPADAGDAGYLHVKDPVVFDTASGDTVLLLCTHPFSWTSANTAYAVRTQGGAAFAVKSWQMVGRGPAWDVAGTRVTCRIPVPKLGVFADAPDTSIYLYDGLECVRPLDENPMAVQRPRGYSCEELGGACYGADDAFPAMTRLSRLAPLFVSPHGTGCSRYAEVLATDDYLLATWQQSQADGSQPLVANRLDRTEIESLLR